MLTSVAPPCVNLWQPSKYRVNAAAPRCPYKALFIPTVFFFCFFLFCDDVKGGEAEQMKVTVIPDYGRTERLLNLSKHSLLSGCEGRTSWPNAPVMLYHLKMPF